MKRRGTVVSRVCFYATLIFFGFFLCASAPANAAIQYGGIFVDSSSGALNAPVQLWMGATGSLYVANSGTGTNGHQINTYLADGTLATTNSVAANRIYGVVSNPLTGKTYASASPSGTIVAYDSLGPGASSTIVVSGLSYPQGLALNADGSVLYVANANGSNIKKYSTSDWSLLSTVSMPVGSKIPIPVTIAVSPNGDYYAVDHRGTNIAAVTGTARVIKFSGIDDSATVFASGFIDTANANTADSPSGVTLDAAGNVYILVQGTRAGGSGMIYKYTSAGTFIESFRPTSPPLNRPFLGIWVASDYRIYVGNTSANRILYFTQTIDVPRTFAAAVTGTTAHLSWTSVADTRLDSFVIRRDTTGFPASATDGVGVTSTLSSSFDDTGLADGTYYYSIFSRDASLNYSGAATASIMVDATGPAAPASFLAAVNSSTVDFTWNNPGDGDFSYVTLVRKTSGFPASANDGVVVSSSIIGTSFSDQALADGTYYYGLFARDTAGNYGPGATSSAVIDTTPPNAPTSFAAMVSGPSVSLSWVNPVADFHSLTLRRDTAGFPATAMSGTAVSTSMTGTSFFQSGLLDGTYYYSLFARDAYGNISNAATASVFVDTINPAITQVTSTPRSTSSVITWETDKNASTKVVYSPGFSYASSTSESDTSPRVMSHAKTILNLRPCSRYHYKVVSTDASNNTSTSTENFFTTTGCVGGVVPLAATSTPVITSAAGASSLADSSTTISVATRAHFTTTSPNVTLQILALSASGTLATLGRPSGKLGAGGVVFELQALIDPQTAVDMFALPATIAYTYSDADINGLAESSLWIYHYHDGAWAALDNCAVDAAQHTVTCTAPNFSVFGLFGEAPAPVSTANYNSGWGGGGGGYYQPIVVPATAANPAPVAVSASVPVITLPPDSLLAYQAEMNSSQPEKTTLAPGFVFKRTLKIGSIGADVRALQQFLNVRGFTVAKKGAGSPGLESIYFGPATAKALAQFQEAHAESILKPFNLKKGTGIFGDMTRRLVNSP